MPQYVVAAPVGAMDATGSGTIETQVQTSVSHTGITHEFRISLPVNDQLFTAFSWADVDTEGNVDASSGQTDFTISLNAAQFKARLMHVIENATGGKPASTFSVSTGAVGAAQTPVAPSNLGAATAIAQTVLDREIRLEVEAELDTNGVLEYLEGDSLGQFSLVLDASGGAADMAEKLGDGTEGTNNTPQLRNLLLQFPNRTDVLGETDASGSSLPVMAGDALAFVFNVTPSVLIAEADQSEGALADATNTASNPLGPTANMTLDNATALSTGTRKIVFVIDVTAE